MKVIDSWNLPHHLEGFLTYNKRRCA